METESADEIEEEIEEEMDFFNQCEFPPDDDDDYSTYNDSPMMW